MLCVITAKIHFSGPEKICQMMSLALTLLIIIFICVGTVSEEFAVSLASFEFMPCPRAATSGESSDKGAGVPEAKVRLRKMGGTIGLLRASIEEGIVYL